jgi:exosome complex component CSL4
MNSVVPGQRLASSRDYSCGPGTFERRDWIHASVLGKKRITAKTLSVIRDNDSPSLPQLDSIITGKVLRVNPRFAAVAIMVVDNHPCQDEFIGLVRVQDIRATEIDKIKVYNCFRPGDIVRARVVSMGDARSYYLSTAENELGVVYATSEAKYPMVAVSWQEMQCTKTGQRELRKCAKPC